MDCFSGWGPPTPHEVSIHTNAVLSVRYRVTNISPSVTFPSLRQPTRRRDSRRTGITPDCERERFNARDSSVGRAGGDWRRASAVASDLGTCYAPAAHYPDTCH